MAQENYKTFDFTPYESNFAEGRREELADRTAKEFYTNKAEYDLTQRAIGSLEVSENDKKYVDNLTDGVNGVMDSVVQTGRFDLGNFAVADATTMFMTDKDVKKSVETYANRKAEDKKIAENPTMYKKYYETAKMMHPDGTPFTAADYKDPNKREFGAAVKDADDNPVMVDLRDMWDSGKQGVYMGDHDPTLDHQARAYKMMQSIADDTVFVKNMIKAYKDKGIDIDAATAKKFILSGQAITQGKVEGLAEELLEMYSKTAEGIQRRKVLELQLSPTERVIPDVTGMGMDRTISQLYNEEEIRAALLNDLVTAGQTQIGTDLKYTGIPQGSSTVVNNYDAGSETLIERAGEGANFDLFNEQHKETLDAIANNESTVYNADGNLKDDNLISISDFAGTPPPPSYDVDGNVISSGTLRLKRIREHLRNNSLEGGAKSVLQIENPNDRAVYIVDEYGANKPDGVTDEAFVYEVEQLALNEAEKLNHIHLFRDEPEQEGSKSGAQLAAAQINNVIYNPGVQIFDPYRYGNPESGQKDHQTSLNLDEWSTNEDNARPGLSAHSNSTAKDRLVQGIQNAMKGDYSDDNGVRILGLSMDSNYPGAIAVTYNPEKTFMGDASDAKPRTIYIQYGGKKEKMMAPAVPYLKFLKDPLTTRNIPLPSHIAHAAGLFPGVTLKKGQEVRMQNKVNYSVDPATGEVKGTPERVIYIANADKSKVKGTAQRVTDNDVYSISQAVLNTYSKYGPHTAQAMRNTN